MKQEHQVTLVCADTWQTVTFVAREGRSIVRSARIAGFELTTGCLQGRCAICRSEVLEGEVGLFRKSSPNQVGDPMDREDGCVLLCSVDPRSDLVIQPKGPWNARTTS